ncbi:MULTISPECIES: hypothetical protein [unclassified Streptomyces]|uniref:hypothetical protein n=1 Tax=unclassified Streptomyces TaxID=2593676 RepID=UPI002258F98F|nr:MULTISPECIES: hypothetical protein [unclassified Streptomyces]MCX4992379.1 hypothetical protein [Streptomyces sp. NBC_00568]MCX5002385.1 hypothetical protein [Streptomyces sp. NBC_00638]
MGTAERSGAPGTRDATREAEQLATQAQDHGIPAPEQGRPDRRRATTGERAAAEVGGTATDIRGRAGEKGAATDGHEDDDEQAYYRPLWIEEPARRHRLPDPVRTSAVRAVLIIAVTLTQAVVAFLCTMAGSWLAFPMVLSSVASTVVATWGALDVWVTRQVWNQRNGVVSVPSSTARAMRRERRKARRQERIAARAQERIRRRGGAGQLSHS